MQTFSSNSLMATGQEHSRLGRWTQAVDCFRAAWRLDPTNAVARHSLATALLGAGRYKEGFPLYAKRRDLPQYTKAPQLPCPEWSGEPLNGKHILLFREQGLGDEIQFARFAPMLVAQGAEVTLFCSPVLEPLLRQLPGVRVIAAAGAVEFPDPDYWAFNLDVPARLGLDLPDLPSETYLRIADHRPSAARIGIMRRGNPKHGNDANRSMPESLRLPFEAVSLAPEDTGAKNMLETAEMVAGLDLVVSVDTSVAHLSGAMGKRTFILLPALACDWRWMSHRTDSPWYPSATLFRQSKPGAWEELLERVGRAVEEAVPNSSSGARRADETA